MEAPERSGGIGKAAADDAAPSSPPSRRAADAAASSTQSRRAVLLYYCYAPLSEHQQSQLAAWYEDQCARRSLYGRVRVAKDGVNATLGGGDQALRALIDAHSPSSSSPPPGLPPDRVAAIDFKLQLCDDDEEDNNTDTDFCPSRGVRVRLCDELVTWGGAAAAFPRPLSPRRPNPDADNPNNPNSFPTHLSPRQFHAFLEAVRRNGGRDPATNDPVVLLDVRNAYETALGRFCVPGVATLDPRTRRLADLPGWIDAHERLLARKTILSYCTGGVRCERAAAILRARGEGFSRVAQLEGGVQRYLEEQEERRGEGKGEEGEGNGGGGGGGFFEGVNFVFDSRGQVGPSGGKEEEEGGDDEAPASSAVVGRCAACGGRGASYAARRRCARCRMLLPLCAACSGGGDGGDDELPPCALCAEREQQQPSLPPPLHPCRRRRRPLRLLCLHGFRSTAGQLRARLRPLERALEGVAELCFLDAPHALPLWYRPPQPPFTELAKPLPPPFPKRAWLASARVLAAAEEGARSGAPPRWEAAPAWLDEEEEEGGEGDDQGVTSSSSIRPRGAAARQDRGWAESVAAVAKAAAAEEGGGRGPFDGALGFSQGAAVLAGLLALRQRQGDLGDPDERAACAAVGRFAVLICGFAPAAPRPLAALEAVAAASAARERGEASPPSSSSSPPLLQVPSLHVFPAEGAESDPRHACVPGEASWALARLFEPSKRAVLRLGGGGSGSSGGGDGGAAAATAVGRGKGGGAAATQMLPATPPRIARVRQFLIEVVLNGEVEDKADE